ncbi:hypothetical protein G7085_04975 [Tessaracoccus sp. HDW20]|nr:hypothetical protein [Tessaracoccus coleopterorum]
MLPGAVRLTYGGETLWAPVRWLDVDPADYAAAGTFVAKGRAVGYAAGLVEADVTVTPTPPARRPTPSRRGLLRAARQSGFRGLVLFGRRRHAGGNRRRVLRVAAGDQGGRRRVGGPRHRPVGRQADHRGGRDDAERSGHRRRGQRL